MKGVTKMAVTHIKNAKSINALITYIQTPKKQDKERVLTSVCGGTTLTTAKRDFKAIRQMYHKDKGYRQGYSMIISWRPDELNPNNPDDIDKAREVVEKIMAEHYDGHQYVSVIQADGDGEKLHAHVAINAINMYTGKSLRGDQVRGLTLAKWSDKIQQDMGIYNANLDRNEWQDKQSMATIKMQQKGEYSWVADLKQRISNCMDNPAIQSVKQFVQSMRDDFNVDVVERNSKKTTTGKMLTYSFTDNMGKKRKIRETKLGNVYGSEGVNYGIADNQKQQQQQQQQQQSINSQLQQQLIQQQLQQQLIQQQQFEQYNGYDDEVVDQHQSTANAEQPRDASTQKANADATKRLDELNKQIDRATEKRLRDADRKLAEYDDRYNQSVRKVGNSKDSEWEYDL